MIDFPVSVLDIARTIRRSRFPASLSIPKTLLIIFTANPLDSALAEVCHSKRFEVLQNPHLRKNAGRPQLSLTSLWLLRPCGILRPPFGCPRFGRPILPARYHRMRLASLVFGSLLCCFVASPLPAQLASGQADPLARGGASAQACSATEASCAEATCTAATAGN